MARCMQGAILGLSLLLITLLLRFCTFHCPVINWDETIYALMADAWLHGHPPYTAIWDNKPPLLYALFAIFQKLIPDPVYAMRSLAVVAATLGAVLVGEVAKARGASRAAALCASLAFATGSVLNGGLVTNAELIMVVFTTAAMLAASTGRPFYAGLAFGAAVFVKHVAVFEGLAVLYALLAKRRAFAKTLLLVALGGCVVPLILVGYLAYVGAFHAFWQDAVLDDLTRVSGRFDPLGFHVALALQKHWIMLYLALFLLRDVAIWLWLLGGVLGILSGKYFYAHYFIQILPALCVAFAQGVDRLRPRRGPATVYAAAVLLPTLSFAVNVCRLQLQNNPDQRAIAARIPRGASLYVFNYEPVLYLLTGSTPPTPYALPTVLSGNIFYHVAQIDPLAEIDRIFNGKPQFVLTDGTPLTTPPWPGRDENPAAYALTRGWLTAHYTRFATFDDAVLYKLDPPGTASAEPPGSGLKP